MTEYHADIGAPGRNLSWLVETVARALDTALRDGRATKDELQHLPLRFFAVEDDGQERRNLTELEKAEIRAVFERRTGDKFYFRNETDD